MPSPPLASGSPHSTYPSSFAVPATLGIAGQPLVYDSNWHGTWDWYREESGQDAHSEYADPKFRNAPAFFQQMEGARLLEFTRDRTYLRGGTGSYAVGDIVEFDFDGVARKVTSVGEDYIDFEPPLDALPIKAGVVSNWKSNEDLTLDFRLSDDSPGRGMSSGGGDVGSSIDISQWRH